MPKTRFVLVQGPAEQFQSWLGQKIVYFLCTCKLKIKIGPVCSAGPKFKSNAHIAFPLFWFADVFWPSNLVVAYTSTQRVEPSYFHALAFSRFFYELFEPYSLYIYLQHLRIISISVNNITENSRSELVDLGLHWHNKQQKKNRFCWFQKDFLSSILSKNEQNKST